MDVTNNNVNGPPSSIVSNNSRGGAPSSSTSPSSGFFLKIRYNQATTSGSKRRVRTEDNNGNNNVNNVDEEEVGDGNDGTVALSSQKQQPSTSTLPPKRIDLDIEGKTYRFRRLTEEEWLTRRVGGNTPAIAPPPPLTTTQALTANQSPIHHSTQPEASHQSSLEHNKDKEDAAEPIHIIKEDKEEVAADHLNTNSGPPLKTTAVASQNVPSGASQKAAGGGSDPGVAMGGAKAIPGLQQGETAIEGIKRRNVESRIKEGRKARQALRVEAIQTYRLLAGNSSAGVGATTTTTTGAVDGGKRERGEEDLTVSSTTTLVGRGVVVTATFSHPEEDGLSNKKNGSTTDIAQQQHSKRRPTPAVQGRASSCSSPTPPQATSVFTAPTTATATTAVKPNPLRDQMEADLNDYYITVLAADRRSKASGRGALTDAQLDKMLMEMAIKKKAEVTTNLVKEQMEYVNSVKSSVYPAPTAPPSNPPKEAVGNSAEANAELAEEYGFGVGGRGAGEYYYALLEGDEADEVVDDEGNNIDQELFDSDSDSDEVADVLGGRFRGKCVGNSRHLYQLFLDDVAAATTTNAAHPSMKGGGDAEAPDADGNTTQEEEEDADFKFNDLSVGPHRDHMVDQWSTQPCDVAQWNSNYDKHYAERDTRVADERVPTTSSSSTAATALSSIKGYLESAMSKHRGEGRRPHDDGLLAGADFDDENDATNGATQFVFDDELAYSGATVGVANRIVKGNVGGEDPEVLYAEDDEYDSNAEEHYQGEYPDESPPSGSENDDDDDDLVASTDDWEFDGDGGAAASPGGGAARRQQQQQQKRARFNRGDDEDDTDDDDDGKQGGGDFYYDPTSTLGADDGMNGLDGFEGDDEEDVPQRRFAAPGAEEEDGEYSAEGVLRKKVVYFEHAEDDDDEY